MEKYKMLPWAALFWLVGFGFFYSINNSQAELGENIAAIERGEGQAIMLTLSKKWIQTGSGSGSDKDPDSHWIAFDRGGDFTDRCLSYKEWQEVDVGQTFEAHTINEDVVITKLDVLQPKAKWIMLGFGLVLGCIPLSMTAWQVMSGFGPDGPDASLKPR